jgi:hypothetical protein
MKVVAYPSDLSGCSYYRILEPIEAAKRAGIEASHSFYFPNKLKRQANGLEKVIGLGELDADVVVFHRPVDYRLVDSIKFLRQAGIAVVIDLDDNLDVFPDGAVFKHFSDPSVSPLENREHTRRACKMADIVTCSTPAIERAWGFGHGAVVRNGVPPHVLKMEHVGGKGIGWSGAWQTHLGDLEVVGDGLQRAMDKTGLAFTPATPVDGVKEVARQFGLREVPETLGWVTPPGEHFSNIAQFDIGIAPLSNTPFSRARSAIKVLEYAALGIPSAASPLPEYERIAGFGVCELAATPDDWAKRIYDFQYYSKEYSEFLRVMAAQHTTDITITSFIDAWELAAAKAQRRLVKR